MNQFETFLTVVEEDVSIHSKNNEFYFGIGGIGDFLLLMSTFYDDLDDNDPDNGIFYRPIKVIFVANNVMAIREIAKNFPRIKLFPFDRASFTPDKETWEIIKSHKCLGSGVTPKNFDYVNDWIECGKTNVFEYYGVRRECWFAKGYPTSINPYVVIQPFGGQEDKTKIKAISEVELTAILKTHAGNNTLLIGSKQEIEYLKTIPCTKSSFIKMTSNIEEAFDAIIRCFKFIGTDSWGKTLAAFSGKKYIDVYPNLYQHGRGPRELFGVDVDPGDNVFLRGWGFNIIDRKIQL